MHTIIPEGRVVQRPDITDPEFQRQVRAVVEHGPRVVGELLLELHRQPERDVIATLGRYAEISPQALRRAGGDRLLPRPLHLVPEHVLRPSIRTGEANRDRIVSASLSGPNGGAAA